MIDAAFAAAAVKLTKISEQEYANMMLKLLEDCASLGDGEITVAPLYSGCFSALLDQIEEKSGARIKLAGEDKELNGGFVYNAGGMQVSCTFESILRQQRDKLEMGVHDLLFGGE